MLTLSCIFKLFLWIIFILCAVAVWAASYVYNLHEAITSRGEPWYVNWSNWFAVTVAPATFFLAAAFEGDGLKMAILPSVHPVIVAIGNLVNRNNDEDNSLNTRWILHIMVMSIVSFMLGSLFLASLVMCLIKLGNLGREIKKNLEEKMSRFTSLFRSQEQNTNGIESEDVEMATFPTSLENGNNATEEQSDSIVPQSNQEESLEIQVESSTQAQVEQPLRNN